MHLTILRCCAIALACWVWLCIPSSFAALGAHGPNGEHLDVPASSVANADSPPQFETMSEHLEITGHLHADGLRLYINHFDSSAPVLDERTEVEVQMLSSATVTAAATFHVTQGAYVVSDTALLNALQTAGEHALILTVIGPDDSRYGSDLLEAKLHIPETAEAAAMTGWLARVPLSFWWTCAALLLLRLLGDVWCWRRRQLIGASA